MKRILIICYLTFSNVAIAQDSLSFLFMGDFMMHEPQINAALDSSGTYNFDHYFKYTYDLINGTDISVANLEVTLAGPPYKGYPQFSAPDEYALAIKNSGIDVLTTANNHSNDRGMSGLIRTLDILDSLEIQHLGTYRNSIERSKNHPLIIEKNNIKVALLNYTYGTNGLITTFPTQVNRIEENLILGDLEIAKSLGVDKIIVITHWGKEYKSYPDKYQIYWADFLFNNGVDAIIGGHPHWIQPMEYRMDTKNGKTSERIIAWSLGNIISNQRRLNTDGGCSIQFTLYKDSNGDVKFKNIGYNLHWVWLNKQVKPKRYHILPLSDINSLFLDEISMKKYKIFEANSRKLFNENNLNIPMTKKCIMSPIHVDSILLMHHINKGFKSLK